MADDYQTTWRMITRLRGGWIQDFVAGVYIEDGSSMKMMQIFFAGITMAGRQPDVTDDIPNSEVIEKPLFTGITMRRGRPTDL